MDTLIPKQFKGKATDAKDCVILNNVDEANELFAHARARMLNINKWHKYSGFASARFMITDANGIECKCAAKKGYYIKIDIPGPGPSSGDGYDWVFIESIESDIDETKEEEFCGMTVRATCSPLATATETAHFFTSDATSTFIVKRNNRTVTVYYHGRNEELNVDTKKMVDKIRNAIIGSLGLAGISEVQWKRLINSFLAGLKGS